MAQIKNDLLLRTLRKETVERVPVWMMRQAWKIPAGLFKIESKI
jgi:uroporphyrinogen-III decarboxylase